MICNISISILDILPIPCYKNYINQKRNCFLIFLLNCWEEKVYKKLFLSGSFVKWQKGIYYADRFKILGSHYRNHHNNNVGSLYPLIRKEDANIESEAAEKAKEWL